MVEVKAKGADEKFCESCGEAIKVKAEICPNCGVRQKASSTRNKIAAGFLALF